MLFTRLIVKNLYSFDNLDIDFTLRGKPREEIIEGEFLEDRPNFYIKRLCVFAGANATGKTSIGRIMCAMQNFLVIHRRLMKLSESITDKTKIATVEIEFVTPADYKLHRCHVELSASNPNTPLEGIKYACVDIAPTNTVKQVRDKLDRRFSSDASRKLSPLIDSFSPIRNRLEEIDKFMKLKLQGVHWNYLFSTNSDFSEKESNAIFLAEDKEALFKVLKGFDNTVSNVETVILKDNQKFRGFEVGFENKDSLIVLANGSCAQKEDEERFSKGTFEAIKVAGFLISMKRGKDFSCTYFMDEKMSASHTVMEKEILNIMINILPRNSQLFYTTHNSEVLDMALPVHSFVLFRKNQETSTEVIQPEFYQMKDTLKEAVMNDVFNTLPDSYEMNDFFLRDI